MSVRPAGLQEQAVSEFNQRAVANLLQASWLYAQELREQTGVVVELRLTTVGLTAFAADAACSRVASISWEVLASSDDLPKLLSHAIRQAAEPARSLTRPAVEQQKFAA